MFFGVLSIMNRQVTSLFAIAFALSVTVSNAAVTSITTTVVPNIIPGFVTNDIFIDFYGEYGGSQLLIDSLVPGSIYQYPNGSVTPPSLQFIGIVPELEFDTFVALGSPNSDGQIGDIQTGGGVVVEAGGDGVVGIVFSEYVINLAWKTPTGMRSRGKLDSW